MGRNNTVEPSYYGSCRAVILWRLYNDNGDLWGLSVPQGQWHNAESLESGTVILECTDGAWKPLGEEDVMG